VLVGAHNEKSPTEFGEDMESEVNIKFFIGMIIGVVVGFILVFLILAFLTNTFPDYQLPKIIGMLIFFGIPSILGVLIGNKLSN